MKIIGIDPGIGRTGWGIIDTDQGDYKNAVYGCISTTKNQKIEIRLLKLFVELRSILEKYRPEEVAIEKIFFNTNSKTAIQVGEARGVALLACSEAKIPVYHYTPLQIKMAITGYGRAEKKQIQNMVKIILKLDTVPSPDDISDALAASLTHAFTNKTLL